MNFNNKTFSSIDFRKNPIVSLPKALISLPLLKELCAALSRVDTVTHLDLSHNQIGDAGAEILAELLFDKPQIRVLNLKSNGITDLGMSFLCRSLARHGTIRSLNLGSNPISDVGLLELGRLISNSYYSAVNSLASIQQQQQQHQQSLSSATDNIVTSDSQHHKNTIASQPNQNNNTSTSGGGPMIMTSANNKQPIATNPIEIEELDLMDTPISLQGTLNFADALVRNESLLQLRLPHVLGHRVLSEIEKLMKRNYIRKNHIDEKRALRIVDEYEERVQNLRISEQWKSHQPKAKPPPPASGFTIDQWSDPELVPSLMFLEILDRKFKMNKKEREQEEKKKNRKVKPTGHGASHSVKLPPIHQQNNTTSSSARGVTRRLV